MAFDLLSLPGFVGTKWGISTFAAGLFLSLLLLLAVFGFLAVFRATPFSTNMIIMVGIPVLGFCVAVTWLSAWILLLVVLMTAAMYGQRWGRVG